MDDLVALAQEGLLLTVAVTLPIVAVALVVSFVVSLLQAATQLSDSTLTHLPRLLAVGLALLLLGPWMGEEIVRFAERAFAFGS